MNNNDFLKKRIIVGCMRFDKFEPKQMAEYIEHAVSHGINYFDHADIYGGGQSEAVFGNALKDISGISREDLIIQSKCGIKSGCYDLSKDYIISSVDGILARLKMEYLDVLLLHRPDALVEPEEVAAAFDELYNAGKVRHFGVSNHRPMQIELLKKCIGKPLLINQLQFSIPASGMIAGGMEVNMDTDGAIDRDGSVLDYCRVNDITIQAWSPFQMPGWRGVFLGNDSYSKLNDCIAKLAKKYNVTDTTIASAWILRHPANMQLIAGTTNAARLDEIEMARNIKLTREEWYELYLAAGHILP